MISCISYQLFVEVSIIDSYLIHLLSAIVRHVLIIDSDPINLLSAICRPVLIIDSDSFISYQLHTCRHVLMIDSDLIHLLSAICRHMDHETTMFTVTPLVTNTLETNLDTLGERAQSSQLENIFGTYVSA